MYLYDFMTQVFVQRNADMLLASIVSDKTELRLEQSFQGSSTLCWRAQFQLNKLTDPLVKSEWEKIVIIISWNMSWYS